MRGLAWILALAVMAIARPAEAYPSSIWNVPTGTCTAAGNLHLANYSYLTPSATTNDTSAFLGLWPGVELLGVPGVGALEAGFDLWTYPATSMYATFHGKLQLVGETAWLPAVAVGGLGLGHTRDLAASDNLVYLAVTKQLAFGEWALGALTLGGFTASPALYGAGPGGWMSGWTLEVTPGLTLAVDYMDGRTSYSGVNAYLSLALTPTLFLAAGYTVSRLGPDQNAWFLALDFDLPTGLYGD